MLRSGGATLGANTFTGTQTLRGDLLFNADATYDIGKSGATRPRDIFSSRDVVSGRDFTTSTGSFIAATSGRMFFNARSIFTSPVDGNILMTNAAATGFTGLQFGGTTSSFPQWLRSTTELHARLADNSGFTNIRGADIIAASSLFGGNAAFMLRSTVTITGGGTAAAPTLTTGPLAGNPTKWLPYDDNGTTRYIPSW